MTTVIRWLPSSLIPLPSGTLPPELFISVDGVWVLVSLALVTFGTLLWIAIRLNLHHVPRRPRGHSRVRHVSVPQRA